MPAAEQVTGDFKWIHQIGVKMDIIILLSCPTPPGTSAKRFSRPPSPETASPAVPRCSLSPWHLCPRHSSKPFVLSLFFFSFFSRLEQASDKEEPRTETGSFVHVLILCRLRDASSLFFLALLPGMSEMELSVEVKRGSWFSAGFICLEKIADFSFGSDPAGLWGHREMF